MPAGDEPGRDGDRVYRAIKARAVACGFGPGEPIRLGLLAAQLGVSTTPVRAALNRLVAEGLVRREPRKGFFAMSMSEERLIGLYRLNEHLVDAALKVGDPTAEVLATATSTIAGIGNELDCGDSTASRIATCTGELFLCIVRLSTNAHVAESIERINNSLHYMRTLESEKLDDVPRELIELCELFLAGRREALAKAIYQYHAHRLAHLPILLADLRR